MRRSFLFLTLLLSLSVLKSQPIVTSFSPLSGPVGTEVVISGAGFSSTPTENLVYFGATQAQVIRASENELTVLVPLGATYKAITVSVSGLISYSNVPFRVTFQTLKLNSSSFSRTLDLNVGSNPEIICYGDLDGDGKPDMVVANADDNDVSILRNISEPGRINFEEVLKRTVGDFPYSIVTEDMDGDGKLDIVLVNLASGTIMIIKNSSVPGSILLEEKKLNIKTIGSYEPGAFKIEVSDFNLDGRPDMLVVNRSLRKISIHQNIGSGPGDFTFDSPPIVLFVNETYNMDDTAMGDFDNDGQTDFVLSFYDTEASASRLRWYRNISSEMEQISFTGDIDIQDSKFFSTTSGDLVPCDLNQDGKLDIIFENYGTYALALINKSNNAGILEFNEVELLNLVSLDPSYIKTLSVGDLDGDGYLDLVTTDEIKGTIALHQNTTGFSEDITFSTNDVVIDFNISEQIGGVLVGDLDGDGLSDLSLTSPQDDQVSIFKHASYFSDLTFDEYYSQDSEETIVSVKLLSSIPFSSIEILSKKIVDKEYQKSEMSWNQGAFYHAFSEDNFDELGLSFFIMAKAFNDSVFTKEHIIILEKEGDTESIPLLKSSSNSLDYSLISIPNQTRPVADIFTNLGLWNEEEMRLAYYNGEDTYQYYPSDFEDFIPGQGYWFLTNRATDFLLKGGRPVEIGDEKSFSIELRANDWNMIGNPYPFDLDWQLVIDHNAQNGIEVEALVTFRNRQFNSGQLTLEKYEGALLYSSADTTIEIPVSSSLSSDARTVDTSYREGFSSDDWRFGLRVQNVHMKYNVSEIGMSFRASLGPDPYDWKLLPRLSSHLDISFDQTMTKSIVPLEDKYVWDFDVNTSFINEFVRLGWNQQRFLDSEYTMVLLDRENQILVDMSTNSGYEFKSVSDKSQFRLFYAHRNEIIEFIELDRDLIGIPFPNPFDTELLIPLSVKHSESHIDIKLYDMSGREVFHQTELMDEGYHQLTLDKEFDSEMLSGTYLIQVTIQSNGKTISEKYRVFKE